jgi:glycosyltransferase involved in cell wall biosynthesis
MHVMLASVSAATSPAGVCRHAANIARGLLAFSSVQKVTMFVGAWQADYFLDAFNLENPRLEMRHAPVRNLSVTRNLWYLRGLPAAARDCGADVIHLAYPMPILRSAYAAPVVVSLHDLYPFDIPANFGRRAWLNRAALKLCLQNVDAIACVSGETQSRLHALFPAIRSDKATIIPNSVFLARESSKTSLPYVIRDYPFLLCVAQHRVNKNLPLLLRTFRLALDRNILAPETKLVLVGKEGPETQHLHQAIARLKLSGSIIFLRGISDTFLSSLYANCKLTIAPSLLEGFGLPVAEALSAGSRVVCSDIPAFRAIDAERCVFFDPTEQSGHSLLAAIQQALATPRGEANSPSGLYPQHAAAMYIALYTQLLLHRPVPALQSSPGDLPTRERHSL